MIISGTGSLVGILAMEMIDPWLKAPKTIYLRSGESIVVPDVFRYCPAVTDAYARGYISICREGNDDASISDAIALETDEIFSNMLMVDSVRGDDCVATKGSLAAPYKTINAAIAAATSGDVLYLLPGNHDLTSGIVMPDNVSIRGVSVENTKIRLLGVTQNTTMIEMGNNNRIEDVYFHLQSNLHVDLICLHFNGTTNATSKIRTTVMLVDNSGAGAGTSNVYGICSHGTGQPSITFSNVRATTMTIKSVGSGKKRGLNATDGSFHLRDVNVNMIGGTDNICLDTVGAGATVTWGIGYLYSDNGISMSQTTGTIELLSTVLLGSADGKGFTVRAGSGTHTFSDPASLPSGTNFMRPGTYNSTSTEAKIRIPTHCNIKTLNIHARVSPGTGKTDVFTVRKNGVDTALTASLTDGQTWAIDNDHSVEFMAGDDLSVKVVKQSGSNTEDVVVDLEDY
jgi:hypothetical protein